MSLLTNIETFVAVVHAKSFAAAAQQLDLSPALIGRRIQALEQHFGVKLIERTTRVQRLTADGEAFLVRAETLLDAAEELEQAMHGGSAALSGRVRITAPTTLGIRRLAGQIAQFRKENRAVTVEMSLSDRQVDLIAEGYDFAVRIGRLTSSNLVAKRIGTYLLAAVASPQWVEAEGLPFHPSDLATKPCVINLNMRPRNRWPFFGPDGQVDVDMMEGLEIDNGEAQRVAACDGVGVAYLPMDLVENDLASGRLVRLLPGWSTMQMPIYLVRPTRNLVPHRVTALMAAITDGFADRSNSD